MKYFFYKAVSGSGEVSTGTLAALNEAEIFSRLSDSGLTPVSCRRSWFALPQKKWKRRELIDFIFHLQQLLTAGIPLLEALAEYRDSAEKKYVKATINRLIADIDNGKKLSEACAASPEVFGPLVVSMFDVGEQSGTIDQVLHDLGELLKWQDETLSRIRRVMMYPSFVAFILLGVIMFVMTWLVPGLISFVKSAGAELPQHTRLLIATSDFVSQYWSSLLIVLLAIFLVCRTWISRSTSARYVYDSVTLKLPLIGPVLYKIKLARFSRCAAMMYGAGISLIDTLKYSEGVVDNRLLAHSLHDIRHRIIEGKSLSVSFSECSVLPSLVGRLVRVGENTGALDNAFNQLGYFYDRESRESVEKLEQGLGPLMIVTVGAIMMWVVVSVMGPIYSLVFGMSSQL